MAQMGPSHEDQGVPLKLIVKDGRVYKNTLQA